MTESEADLLYGVPAIAEHLNLRERQVYHLISKGHLPTFKLGDRVCARRSSLASWLADQEAAARVEGRKPEGDDI